MDEEASCDTCQKDCGNWRNWYIAEHNTDANAEGAIFCSPECREKWLAKNPEYHALED
jgi:hypothetical protein